MKNNQRNIIAVAILVIAGCLTLVYLYLGQGYRDALTSKATVEADITTKTARLENIKSLMVPLTNLEPKVALIDQVGLPKGAQLPDLIEEVEQLVLSQPGIVLNSFSPNLAAANNVTAGTLGTLQEQTFSLTVSCNPDQLSSLLNSLNASARPMYVKGITITPDSKIAGVISAALSISTYNFPFKTSVSATNTSGGATTP